MPLSLATDHLQGWTVAKLGTAQTLAWASSYYLPAMIAAPMARDLGVSTPTVFAAFSAALIVSAVLGPHAGRAIDSWGAGRSLPAPASCSPRDWRPGFRHRTGGLFAGLVIGHRHGQRAVRGRVRGPGAPTRPRSASVITGITLIAGFASTVGWPLTTMLEAHFGWRGACLTWAALHVFLGLPLNWSLPRRRGAAACCDADHSATTAENPAAKHTPRRRRTAERSERPGRRCSSPTSSQ